MPIGKDDAPVRGAWYWVTFKPRWEGEKAKECTELMCCSHIGSNFVTFDRASNGGGTWDVDLMLRDFLAKTKPEPNWKKFIDEEIVQTQKQLHDAVIKLQDRVKKADLLPQEAGTPVAETMLPSTTRVNPKKRKYSLLVLRDRALPAAEKSVKELTERMVALQRDTMLPMLVECDRMIKVKGKIEERLFVLELYAGLGEDAIQISNGEPAPEDTPITIRQMLRYMDEECLIDYDCGGMDYRKLEDFDRWIAEPRNYKRILPEERCVVAFKIRRHHKDYGPCEDIGMAFWHMEQHLRNMKTYLCIRNGNQLWRLDTEVEFDPRLLPFQKEFHKPFEDVDEHGETQWDKPGYPKKFRETETVTPEDIRYDAYVEERRQLIFKYNRVLFLIQGILDRSKVFSPHPPINLSDPDHVDRFIRLNFDEEQGLPSSNPPKWEEYRDGKNASIKKGTHVWARWIDKNYDRYNRYDRDRIVTGVYEVTSVKKDRSAVRISWLRGKNGKREGWEHPTGWWSGWGKWGEWEYKNKYIHKWVPIHDTFNLDAYVRGEYKTFLCDAYLKGAYLEWAPQLLSAEKYWREPNENQ